MCDSLYRSLLAGLPHVMKSVVHGDVIWQRAAVHVLLTVNGMRNGLYCFVGGHCPLKGSLSCVSPPPLLQVANQGTPKYTIIDMVRCLYLVSTSLPEVGGFPPGGYKPHWSHAFRKATVVCQIKCLHLAAVCLHPSRTVQMMRSLTIPQTPTPST